MMPRYFQLWPIMTLLLVLSCGRLSPTEPRGPIYVLRPACSEPAPLFGENDRQSPLKVVDQYIVLLRPGFLSPTEGARLAAKYGFTVDTFMTFIPAFVATLDPHVVANLRCESSVQNLQFAHAGTPVP
jgi:hypothetical protein